MRIQIENEVLQVMLLADITTREWSAYTVDVAYAVYPIVGKLNAKTGMVSDYVPMVPIVKMDLDVGVYKQMSPNELYTQQISYLSDILKDYEPIAEQTIEFPQSHSVGLVRGIRTETGKEIRWCTNTATMYISHDGKEHQYEVQKSGLNVASSFVYSKETGEAFHLFRKDKWWSELSKHFPPK